MAGFENAFVAGLALIGLFFLIWLVLSRLSRRWQNQFVQRATRLRLELEGAEKALSRIEREAKGYATADPEPYGPLARDLHQALAQAQKARSNRARQRSQLFRGLPAPRGSRFSRFWSGLSVGFFRWRQLQGEAESLWESAQALKTQLAHAEGLLQDLRGLPLTVARRCSALRKVGDEIAQIVGVLYNAGLHGDTFDAAAVAAEQLGARLMGLPDRFFQSAEHRVIKGATRQGTILAWQTLGEIEEPIRGHGKVFQGWQLLHRQAGRMLEEMRAEIEAAQQGLAQLSGSIDASALAASLEESSVDARELEGQYLAPTVEILDALHGRARQIAARSRDLTKLSALLRQQLDGLCELIRQSAGWLDGVEAAMKEGARAERYPIDWGHYRAKLDQLRQIEVEVGSIAARRTPDRLYEHLTMAQRLVRESRQLEGDVTAARAYRHEMLPLLDQPGLAAGPTWLMWAGDLHQQVSRYAPENWPTESAVSEILNDARELAGRHRQWVPAHTGQPLPAARLDHRLDQVKRLADDLQAFGDRLQQIDDTLVSAQKTEQAVYRELNPARQALDRLTTSMSRAKLALTPSLVRCQQRLEKLWGESHQLASDLERREVGLVGDKARDVDDWTGSCCKALRAVLKELQTESRKVETELRDEVEGLQALAPFDREQAMKEAMALLAVERPADLPLASADGDGIAVEMVHLADQAGELLRYREALYPALENIGSQIGDRVDDLYVTLQEARQEAHGRFDELKALKRASETNWPPLICNTRPAEGLMNSASRDEEQLRNSGQTVSNVLKLVRKLIRSYKDVIKEAGAKERKNVQDRRNLQEFLDRLDRWQGQLETYRQSHRDDPAVAKAVQTRLSQIDKAISRAKRRYRRDPLSYTRARAVLQELWSLAHGEDLPIRGSDRTITVREVEGQRAR